MVAFAKLLVLIAIFLLASNANVFTSLSPVAGNQKQEIHWFHPVEPMSKPMNKPTGEPTKTRVAYSEPKQDAELPTKITDSTNTQPCGLCHGKKSELESLAEQPIATTKSSQCGLCHGKKSELESFAEQPIATTNSSQRGLCHGKKSELESLAEQPIREEVVAKHLLMVNPS